MKENEWLEKRLGNFTASEIWKLFVDPKTKADKESGKLSETALSYVKDKVCELLTGLSGGSQFENEAMRWGKTNESYAIEIIRPTFQEENIIHYGGNEFKFNQFTNFSGSSPDAESESYVYEVKCPFNSSIHLDHLGLKSGDELKEYNKSYWYQIQFNMICSNKDKGVFISYDPRFKHVLQIKTLVIDLDENFRSEITEKLKRAESEMRSILDGLGI